LLAYLNLPERAEKSILQQNKKGTTIGISVLGVEAASWDNANSCRTYKILPYNTEYFSK